MAEQRLIGGRGLDDARHGLLGENQGMRRGLRIDVADGEDEVIFVNDLRGDFAGDDFFKKGFHQVLNFKFLILSSKKRKEANDFNPKLTIQN